MPNLIPAKPAPKPSSSGCSASSRTPQPDAHREWIGGQAMMLLAQFYVEDEAVVAAGIKLWIDTLEVLPQAAIEAGVVDYMRHGPRSRSGRLLKPSPGDLYAAAVKFRLRPVPSPKPPEPARKPITAERANEIMAEMGFRPRVRQ